MEIKKLDKQDLQKFIDLIDLFKVVFETENIENPTDAYLEAMLNKEDFLVLVAIAEQEILGGLTAYILPQCQKAKPIIYIYDLAVKTVYQRQGIGKLLIEALKYYAKKHQIEEIFVQADLTDTHALDFYKATNAIGLPTVQFTYILEP